MFSYPAYLSTGGSLTQQNWSKDFTFVATTKKLVSSCALLPGVLSVLIMSSIITGQKRLDAGMLGRERCNAGKQREQ